MPIPDQALELLLEQEPVFRFAARITNEPPEDVAYPKVLQGIPFGDALVFESGILFVTLESRHDSSWTFIKENTVGTVKESVTAHFDADRAVEIYRHLTGAAEAEAEAAMTNPCSFWLPASTLRGLERGRRYGNFNWIKLDTTEGPIAVYQEPAHNDGFMDAMRNGMALFVNGVWREDLETWVRERVAENATATSSTTA